MRHLALGALAAFAVGGCFGARGPQRPDEQFGHRYPDVAPDGRETVLVEAPSDSADAFLTFPAVLDSVAVRPAAEAVLPGAEVPVELLVKGALPDACSALDRATQERAGHLVTVTLMMRQPRGALCAQVVRPFRFYLPLEGTFAPGAYTVFLNGTAYPFRIREEADPSRQG